MFLCTLNLCLLNGIFRPLTFSVITDIIELISTIFVTVFFFLPLIIVPVFTISLTFVVLLEHVMILFFLLSQHMICAPFLVLFHFLTFLLVALEFAIYITNIMDP